MNLINTPAGASSTAAAVISLIVNTILPPVWPWFADQSQAWRGGIVTVLIFVLSYLAAWLKVVLAKGQKITTELTSSKLPTLQAAAGDVATVVNTITGQTATGGGGGGASGLVTNGGNGGSTAGGSGSTGGGGGAHLQAGG